MELADIDHWGLMEMIVWEASQEEEGSTTDFHCNSNAAANFIRKCIEQENLYLCSLKDGTKLTHHHVWQSAF